MKALTLTQPWAQLVAIGAKKIETRSWSTKYRGPLAIHAAKRFPLDAKRMAIMDSLYWSTLAPMGFQFTGDFPLGMIVATCELVRIQKIITTLDWPDMMTPEFRFGNYTLGRYMWFLENVELLPEPIPAKGALSLWEWDGAGLPEVCSLGHDMSEGGA